MARAMAERDGHEVVSSWLDEPTAELTPWWMKMCALNDWHDLKQAECVVQFTDWPSTTGGRFVEMGLALERGIKVVEVGSHGAGVYSYLPEVGHYDTFQDFLESIYDESEVVTQRVGYNLPLWPTEADEQEETPE